MVAQCCGLIVPNRIVVYELTLAGESPMSFNHVATLILSGCRVWIVGFSGNRLFFNHFDGPLRWRSTVWDFKTDSLACWCLADTVHERVSHYVSATYLSLVELRSDISLRQERCRRRVRGVLPKGWSPNHASTRFDSHDTRKRPTESGLYPPTQ